MLENNINTPSPPFLFNSPSPTPNLQETRVGLKFKRPLQQWAIVNPVLQSEELGLRLVLHKSLKTKICTQKFSVYHRVYITHCEPKDRYFSTCFQEPFFFFKFKVPFKLIDSLHYCPSGLQHNFLFAMC
jgi:hypothetical protein